MKHAAFFRNLNLGRANCPTRAQLEAAFLSAGAETASSFLTNGTLVFSAQSGAKARKVLKLACQSLLAECGLREPAYLREVEYLPNLVASLPFKSVAPGSVYACCVSFLPPTYATPAKWPRSSARGDVDILSITDTEVFSVSRKIAKSPSRQAARMRFWKNSSAHR